MTPLLIHNDLSLRDILIAYPQTRPVLSRYGLMECGGATGPDEPLGWFARVHHVDPDQLMRELQEAIGQQTDHESAMPQAEPPRGGEALDPDSLFRRFLVTAITFVLTGGVLWGAINLSLIGYHHEFVGWLTVGNQAHGHVQIFGWVSLFIMGIAYHVVPRLKAAPLQDVALAYHSYWLMAGGVLLHAIYRPFMANPALAPITVMAGLMEVAAAVLFALVMVNTMRKGTTGVDLADKYLVAGIFAFVAMTVMNAVMLSWMAATHTAILPAQWNWAYRHVQLDGFAVLFIFGVSLRTLPVFLGKPQPRAWLDSLVFPLLILGLVLRAAVDVLVQFQMVAPAMLAIPAVIECLAVFGFIWNVGVFRRTVDSLDGLADASRAYEKYLYAAYGWLVVATIGVTVLTLYHAVTGAAAPHALMGGYRHALTVGFITIMILGYSMRTLPVFLGRPVHSLRLLNVTFALIMLGCTLRVLFQALTVPVGDGAFAVAGLSGWVEAVALALYGYNLLRTLYHPVPDEAFAMVGEAAESTSEITASLPVARLVELYPQTLDILVSMGFEPLANPVLRQTLGKRITIAKAAEIKHIPVDALLTRLREVA